MAKDESPIRIYVNGLRNAAAEFEGGLAELEVGGMAAAPWVPGGEESVLLTAIGTDEKTGEPVDIEIAVPMSQVETLVERLRNRAGTLEN